VDGYQEANEAGTPTGRQAICGWLFCLRSSVPASDIAGRADESAARTRRPFHQGETMASPAFPTVRYSPTPTVIYGGDAQVVADNQLRTVCRKTTSWRVRPLPRPFGQTRGGNM